MSNAERQKRYRDKQRNAQEAMAKAAGVTAVPDYGVERNAQEPESVTRVTPEQEGALRLECASGPDEIPPIDGNVLAGKPTLAHYHARPDLYVARREPELLNWGEWMSARELDEAGLKANRVAIPGDWDYKGAAVFIPGLPLSAALAGVQEACV